MASNTIFENATGTTISGNVQVVNAGHDVTIVHGPPAGKLRLYIIHLFQCNSLYLGLSQLLRPVSNATHIRSGPVAKCYSGTRLKVIDMIEQWLDRRGKQSVCWLNGPAGYGKSALSQTITERYADKGRLLGSFFFLRGAGDRSHIARLIPTLAHQISISVPATKQRIDRALKEDCTLLDSSVSIVHQFRTLITNPLSSLSTLFLFLTKSKILVIDGLDECDDKVQMAEFIEMLIDMSQRDQLPFCIFLTSRVEEHIRKKFGDARAQSVLYCIDLAAFDARRDIQLYFEREFGCIYDQNLPIMRRIPQPWPSSQALSVLLDKAGSSFMFAATLVRLVGEDPMPYKILQEVLDSGSNGLDPLYKQVLSSASQTPAFR